LSCDVRNGQSFHFPSRTLLSSAGLTCVRRAYGRIGTCTVCSRFFAVGRGSCRTCWVRAGSIIPPDVPWLWLSCCSDAPYINMLPLFLCRLLALRTVGDLVSRDISPARHACDEGESVGLMLATTPRDGRRGGYLRCACFKTLRRNATRRALRGGRRTQNRGDAGADGAATPRAGGSRHLTLDAYAQRAAREPVRGLACLLCSLHLHHRTSAWAAKCCLWCGTTLNKWLWDRHFYTCYRGTTC